MMENLYLMDWVARERHAESIRRAEANHADGNESHWGRQRNDSDGIIATGALAALFLAALFFSQQTR